MKILLDTHVLLWLLEDNPRLTSRARQLIDDKENELCFSSISIAEIAIKHRKNPRLMPPAPDEVRRFAIASDIGELNFTSGHAIEMWYKGGCVAVYDTLRDSDIKKLSIPEDWHVSFKHPQKFKYRSPFSNKAAVRY